MNTKKIIASVAALSAFIFCQITSALPPLKAYALEEVTDVTAYSYEIIPLLEPFNEYFFVKTDNPDPISFRFVDKDSGYTEEEGEASTISVDYDSWDEKMNIYADVDYEDKETGRVNGGYIFKSFNTDGGEVVLQKLVKGYYRWDDTYEDTDVKLNVPVVMDDADYLIKTYAKGESFFDNMDAVQEGFSDICLYSGSYVRGKVVRNEDYWCLARAGHIDQSFYIYSPYDRVDSVSLFASRIYPYRYDSLGFPGMMGIISERLDSSSEYKWSSTSHYLIEVIYNGETRTYGGAGDGEGQGISEDKIIKRFNFDKKDDIDLEGINELLKSYMRIEMTDDIPRDDELTFESICKTVGKGSWVRLNDSNVSVNGKMSISPGYSYLYSIAESDEDINIWSDEWGEGNKLLWGGTLGYASDAWIDGRYVNKWKEYEPGAVFTDHPTSDIMIYSENAPVISYETAYERDDEGNLKRVYKNVRITEEPKLLIYHYSSSDDTWKSKMNSSIDYMYINDEDLAQIAEEGLIDKKYIDMLELTRDEVNKLGVDRNTNKVPDKGYIYDGTVEPGTYSEKLDVFREPKGDVNDDGTIDIEDAVMVINHVNGVCALSDEEVVRADIDSNTEIDIEDAVAIISHVNGIRALS